VATVMMTEAASQPAFIFERLDRKRDQSKS
jgi:hypothetical protein